MSIDVKLSNYNSILNEIGKMESNAQKVIDRTLKDFKTRGVGWVAQEVVKEYNIKKSDVNKSGPVGRIKVTNNNGESGIVYQGHPLTPLHFSITPKQSKGFRKGKTLVNAKNLNVQTPYHTKNGEKPVAAFARIPRKYKVNVTIKKGEKKELKGKYDTPVFMASVKGARAIPFQRVPETDKMESIKTVSLPQMVDNDEVQKGIGKAIDEKLGKRFDHYSNMYLKK